MLTSTNRTRDPGRLQPMQECPPGLHADWSFLTDSNAPTQTRPHSTHLCRSYSPTLTSPPGISFWMGGPTFDRRLSVFWLLSSAVRVCGDATYMGPVPMGCSTHGWKQRNFLPNIDWAVNVERRAPHPVKPVEFEFFSAVSILFHMVPFASNAFPHTSVPPGRI